MVEMVCGQAICFCRTKGARAARSSTKIPTRQRTILRSTVIEQLGGMGLIMSIRKRKNMSKLRNSLGWNKIPLSQASEQGFGFKGSKPLRTCGRNIMI